MTVEWNRAIPLLQMSVFLAAIWLTVGGWHPSFSKKRSKNCDGRWEDKDIPIKNIKTSRKYWKARVRECINSALKKSTQICIDCFVWHKWIIYFFYSSTTNYTLNSLPKNTVLVLNCFPRPPECLCVWQSAHLSVWRWARSHMSQSDIMHVWYLRETAVLTAEQTKQTTSNNVHANTHHM